MEYQIDGIPGFESRKVVVTPSGIVLGPKLIVDGEVIKNRWGKYLLKRNDGTIIEARLRSNFVDSIPHLSIDGKKYFAVAPLKWYELLWAGWPIALFFVGGAIGAFCGALAAFINSRVFRSEFSPVMKYLITGLISILSILLYLVCAALIYIMINRTDRFIG